MEQAITGITVRDPEQPFEVRRVTVRGGDLGRFRVL